MKQKQYSQFIFLAFTLIFFFSYLFSSAQKAENNRELIAKNDSLKIELQKLNKIIQEGSYTRIPNKDFEGIITNKIENSIRDTFKWWLLVIGGISSLLGFLINKYANEYLQKTIAEKIDILKKDNEDAIKKLGTKYFSTIADNLMEFKIERITKQDYSVIDESVVKDLLNDLEDESIVISTKKKVNIIDTIMRCYYKNDIEDKYTKMIDLIKKYEEKFKFMSTTYANAAIAFLNIYELYGNKEYLNNVIENCDKTIKALPDYGDAFAFKLESYMVAIDKSYDDSERKQYKMELEKVFKDIDNNKGIYLCKELINRLQIDKDSYLRNYIEKLFLEYPKEIEKIKSRIEVPPIDEKVT